MAIAQLQSIKEQIMQDLEPLSLENLQQVLAYVQQLNPVGEAASSAMDQPAVPENCRPEVWHAYLVSKRERGEVYRRLADS